MKLKDVVCVLALLAVSAAAFRVVLAADIPCTGWAGPCKFSPTPPPEGVCCRQGEYGSNNREFRDSGIGSKLYTQATGGTQCGDTAETFMMGDSNICMTVTSYGTCGGNLAQEGMCTPPKP